MNKYSVKVRGLDGVEGRITVEADSVERAREYAGMTLAGDRGDVEELKEPEAPKVQVSKKNVPEPHDDDLP